MLLDPRGNLVTSQKRELVVTNPDIARFAAMADGPFKWLNLTVVCTNCGGTPVGKNHPNDPSWKLECACTVRVLKNPKGH